MSLLKTTQEKIDGYTIKATQLPTIQAWKMKAKIIKMIGPALSSLNSSGRSKAENKAEINEMLFLNAIGTFSEKLDPDDFINLILEILHGVYINGKEFTKDVHIGDKDNFNIYMAGKMILIYKIVYHVFKLNFEDFFLMMESNIGNFSGLFQKTEN